MPLDPLTITVKLPAEGNVHDNVEVPDPVTLVGLSVHALLLADTLTVPPNPLRDVTAIVEVPAEPAFTVTLVVLAVTVKSCTRYVTLDE